MKSTLFCRNGKNTELCEKINVGTLLEIKWLWLGVPNARGPGLIPGHGIRSQVLQLNIPSASTKTRLSHKKKKKKETQQRGPLGLGTYLRASTLESREGSHIDVCVIWVAQAL